MSWHTIGTQHRELSLEKPEVLARLTRQARGNLAALLNDDGMPDPERVSAAGDTVKRYKVRRRSYTDRSGVVVTETAIELELYDAQAALIALGRAYDLFTTLIEARIEPAHGETVERLRAKLRRLAEADGADEGEGPEGVVM